MGPPASCRLLSRKLVSDSYVATIGRPCYGRTSRPEAKVALVPIYKQGVLVQNIILIDCCRATSIKDLVVWVRAGFNHIVTESDRCALSIIHNTITKSIDDIVFIDACRCSTSEIDAGTWFARLIRARDNRIVANDVVASALVKNFVDAIVIKNIIANSPVVAARYVDALTGIVVDTIAKDDIVVASRSKTRACAVIRFRVNQ